MIKKAKRVKSLPVQNGRKDYGTSGVVDESLPESATIYLQHLSNQFGDELLEWFQRRIGRYRSFQEMEDKKLTKSEELQAIDQTISYLRETSKRLNNLPPDTDCFVNEACWRRHQRLFHGWNGLLEEMDVLIREADTLLAIAWQKIDKYPSKSGTKYKWNRDALLTDITDHLVKQANPPIKKRQAAEIARDLLNTLAISVPDDLGEVEKLIRNFKKRMEKQALTTREKETLTNLDSPPRILQ